MVPITLEKETSSQKLQHELKHLINRLTQRIENEGKIPDEFLEREIEKIENNFSKEIDEERILEQALNQVREDFGGFPDEKLSKKYEELVLERIVKETIKRIELGEDKYSVLSDYGKELKKMGLSHLSKEIEKRINDQL